MSTSRLARLVSGRRSKWLVLVLWIAIVMIAGPLAGQLTSVQNNDTVTWLPDGAESTQVMELQKQFQPEELLPAVIVYERAEGITGADQAKAAADATAMAAVPGVVGQITGPIPAPDGKALQTVVALSLADGGDKIVGHVDALKEAIGEGSGGLDVHVTGPAGHAADSAKAFEGIDGALLMATLVVVTVILLLTYRSPVLWLLPIVTAGIALFTAQAVIYLLAKNTGLVVNGQSAGILTVLVFGASTDYALLLVARYREELRRHADRHQAMAIALHRAGPAIIASAATVTVGMSLLTLVTMNSTSGLGPVTALGIVAGLIAMITLLPALLVIFGRWLFWPVRPKHGSAEPTTGGVYARLAASIGRRPRVVWIVTAAVLGVMSLGLFQLNANGLSAEDSFTTKQPSVTGGEALARHFPAGQGQPVTVIANAAQADQVRQALAGTPGITAVGEPVVNGNLVQLDGTLQDTPDSEAAQRTVERVRDAVHAVPGADAKAGGQTALLLDTNKANIRDNWVIIPLVLLAVLLILMVLLRAVVAPLILMATVVLSFGAALGVSALIFRHVFGFAGEDTSFPLYVFVFLVALGIDYNIFLMTRVREEAQQHGTRKGSMIGLAATGGVITSAGIVLAGTFAALASLPLVSFVEMGFAVALGVLLDTLVVRSILVTALNLDVGRKMWWPSKLAQVPDQAPEPEREPAKVDQVPLPTH